MVTLFNPSHANMKLKLSLFFFSLLIQFTKCNRRPAFDNYENVKGYVIGKEYCNIDSTIDYWLIELSYLNPKQYGDTLLLNGITYLNVVKTKGLDQTLKHLGMRVSIDFKTITLEKIQTTGCTIA